MELAPLVRNVVVEPVFVLPTAKEEIAEMMVAVETLAVSVHHPKLAKMVNVQELLFLIVQEDNVVPTEPVAAVEPVEVVKDAEPETANATTTVMKETAVTLFNHPEPIPGCVLKDLVVPAPVDSLVEVQEDVQLRLPVL